MTVGKQPLGFVSFSGDDPKMPLDAPALETLANILGVPLGEDARADLTEVCNQYMAERRRDLAQQTYQDVEKAMAPYRAAAKALWNLAYREGPMTDAVSELDSIVDIGMRDVPIQINPDRDLLLGIPQSDGGAAEISRFADCYEPPEFPHFVELSRRHLEHVAMNLTIALNKAEKVIAERAAEAADRQKADSSFTGLIHALTKWAKTHDINYAARTVSDDPAPFSVFVHALRQITPEPYREALHGTVTAIADKIKRDRTRRNKLKKRQSAK